MCKLGCDEYVCSQCEDHHAVMCYGTRRDGAPWFEFKSHARETNIAFILAAKSIIGCAMRMGNERDVNELQQDPLFKFKRRIWWQDEPDPEARDTMIMLTRDSLALLRAAVGDAMRPDLASVLLSEQFFAELMGLIELNSIDVDIPGPLLREALKIDDMSGKERSDALQVLVEKVEDVFGTECTEEAMLDISNRESEGDNDYSLGDVFHFLPRITGSALFSVIGSTINHSCVPTALVSYLNDATAQLHAIRAIHPGSEITISYVDEHAELSERTEALQNYGFTCSCKRCETERAGLQFESDDEDMDTDA